MKKVIIALTAVIVILAAVFVTLELTEKKNNSETPTVATQAHTTEYKTEPVTEEPTTEEMTTEEPTTEEPTTVEKIQNPTYANGVEYQEVPTEAIKTQHNVKVNSFKDLALLNERDAWLYITDGSIITDDFEYNYPMISFGTLKQTIERVRREHSKYIAVKVWQWAGERNASSTDLTKVEKTIKLEVHEYLAPVLTQIFDEIFNAPDKPVLYSAGSWVIRGKGNDDKRTPSAHSWGCCIDFNATTNINGVGNTQFATACTLEIFNSLPNTQAKYEMFYNGGTVVDTFKKYGFYWGGDWDKSSSDPMHFSFLGDIHAREAGVANYLQMNK